MNEQELIELIQTLNNLSIAELKAYILSSSNKKLKLVAISLLNEKSSYKLQNNEDGISQFQKNYEEAKKSVLF